MSALQASPTASDPLSRLLTQVGQGEDVLVLGTDVAAAELLDVAAARLESEQCRVVRVRAVQPGLSLSLLMAQIAGSADLADQDDAVVKLGYQRLAVPDLPEGRVVLLVSGAEWLQRPALRFIQHVGRSARALILVLAGGPGLLTMLDGEDFTTLRTRLTAAPAIVQEAAAPLSAPIIVTLPPIELPPLPQPPSRRRGFVGPALVGVAASVGFGVLIGHNLMPAPRDTMPADAPALASATPAAPAVATASPARDGSPPAGGAPQPQEAEALPPVAGTAPRTIASLDPVGPLAATSTTEAQGARGAEDVARPRPVPRPKSAEARPKEPAKDPARESSPLRRRDAIHVNQKLTESEPDRAASRPAPRWRPPPAWDATAGFSAASPAAGPVIGTYTADSNGVRTFHFGP